MAEESWHAARLIPTSGINGAEEQERRATSALLAVMSSVKEFGRAILGPLGAPVGPVETFIEVPFALGDRDVRPDGLIRVRRGARTWTALVEVKTGKSRLQADQLEDYLDVAREAEFDALVTISNQIPVAVGVHPVAVDRRKLRKVRLHHLSWSFLLAQAVMQKEHRGVCDPDQAWILGELIRYLEHPKSGALEFDDMGSDWVPVREAVAAGTLRAGDAMIDDVVSRFDALVRYAALHLGRRLGTEVVQRLTRKEHADPSLRAAALRGVLAESGRLSASIRVPGAVAPIRITADLRAATVVCDIDVEAPRTGRPTTRVNWLVRQLRHASDGVRVEAFALNQRGPGTAELLGEVRRDAGVLVADAKREIRSFRVARSTAMGAKRGRGRGSFIDSVLEAVDGFYEEVAEHLKAWSPAPPRLRPEPERLDDAEPALTSTAISSQDGPQPPTQTGWPLSV